jgi:hypothetical protein
MVRLEKIQSALFPKLYSAFLRDDDPLSDEQDWRNIFDYRFDKEHDHCGYALLDDGQVIGMIGMIYSRRVIDGADRKFCNLHTWWVVQAGSSSCYCLYTHVVRHRLPYCHVHCFSDREVFAASEPAIRHALLQRNRARFVALDKQLVPHLRFRRSFRFWAPAHGLFRSTEVRPDQIDHLYSDVVFLKLTTLPDISHELKRRILRREDL